MPSLDCLRIAALAGSDMAIASENDRRCDATAGRTVILPRLGAVRQCPAGSSLTFGTASWLFARLAQRLAQRGFVDPCPREQLERIDALVEEQLVPAQNCQSCLGRIA